MNGTETKLAYFDLQYFNDGEELGGEQEEQSTDTQTVQEPELPDDPGSMSDEQVTEYLASHSEEPLESEVTETLDEQPAPETDTQQEEEVSLKERLENAQKLIGRQGTELHESRTELQEARTKLATMADSLSETDKTALNNMTEEERFTLANDPEKFREFITKSVQETMRVESLKNQYGSYKANQERDTVKANLSKALQVENMDTHITELLSHTEKLVTEGRYTAESFAKFKADPFNPIYQGNIESIHLDMTNKRLSEENARLKAGVKTGKDNLVKKINKATSGKSVVDSPGATKKDWSTVTDADIGRMTEAEEMEFMRSRGTILQ